MVKPVEDNGNNGNGGNQQFAAGGNGGNSETFTSVQALTHASGAVNTGDDAPREGTFVTHVKGSKAQRAQDIFNQIGGTAPRKEVIKRFTEEVGLSVSGASTYYQNMKAKAGLVHKRELVTTRVDTIAQGEAIANNSGTRGNDYEKGSDTRVGGDITDRVAASGTKQ